MALRDGTPDPLDRVLGQQLQDPYELPGPGRGPELPLEVTS